MVLSGVGAGVEAIKPSQINSFIPLRIVALERRITSQLSKRNTLLLSLPSLPIPDYIMLPML